jgi:hypothetical protein
MATILRRYAAGILCVAGFAGISVAQERPREIRGSGIHSDTLIAGTAESHPLKPLIVPGSERITVEGTALADSLYRIDYRYGRLWFVGASRDTVVVNYRTYPFTIRDEYFRRTTRSPEADTVLYRDISEVAFVDEPDQPADATSIFGDSKLERHGSISRGIIAGNNRSVSLESGLRMQLAGEVTEGVNVRAVLTDENTPIQPDGTTQRLNEFDRVFIELETASGTATLGDYDLRFAGSEFGIISRKLLGISVTGRSADPFGSAVGPTSVTVAGATSRGIFNSMPIVPIEGVQGPYRLEGRNGERFIILIAGSERVYWDGVLLVRGEQNDYVVDYTTGEVTFTSNRIVAEDRRITVEYEYTTSRYTRSLLATEALTSFWQREDGSPIARFGATFIRESDSKTFTDALGVSSTDSLALAQAGDGLAVVPGDEQVPFDPEASFVQYVKRDTLFADSLYTIFEPVTDTAGVDSVFRVRFTQVPVGQGSYGRSGQSLNGIVFTWVGPGFGDYVPLRVLPKPVLQRMVDLTGSIEPIRGVEVFGEWARSLYDQNRLSDLDSDDDDGQAYRAGVLIKPINLELGSLGAGQLTGGIKRRHTDGNFESFDRIRPVEFRRKWNLVRPVSATGSVGTDEDLTEAYTDLNISKHSLLHAEWGSISLGDGFSGSRLAFEGFTRQPGKTQAGYRIEAINSSDTLLSQNGKWLRQLGSLNQPLLAGSLIPGVEVEHEDRQQRDSRTGALDRTSQQFIEIRPTLTYATGLLTATALVEYRTEDGIADSVLVNRADSWTGQAKLTYRQGRNFTTEADVGYRTKRYTDAFIQRGEEDAESIAIRWTSRVNGWRRAIQTNLFYEALTEKTPVLQETYVRTGTEIGQFVWEDANGDGIRQIDEFLPERTPFEGTYVRTFLPSDDLESVINVQARVRLTIDPRLVFRRPSLLWKKILSRVTSQTILEVADKSTRSDATSMYFLDQSKFRDPETTLSGRLRIEQRLEFFKGMPKFGGTLSFSNLESLSRLSAGFEERARISLRGTGRYRVSQRVRTRVSAFVESNRSSSSEFSSRDFDIDAFNIEPELSVSPAQALQVSLSVAFSSKTDHVGDASGEGRSARLWKFPLQATYAIAQKLQVSGRFEVASVDLVGDAVGFAAFELTDGRGPGESLLWNVNGSYAITSLIRASLSYDGRSPSDAPTIHTVRTQFSLVF